MEIKRYESITVLKGAACLMVLMSHWYDTFYGWGSTSADTVIKVFPFSILYNGNLAVCAFMILSAFLVSVKVCKNEGKVPWTEIVLKRYFRLTVPIAALYIIVLILYKMNLFYNMQASELLSNEWLKGYYCTKLNLWLLVKDAFAKTITLGDNAFYGPLWMMKYMFWGTFFSSVFCCVVSDLNKKGQIILTVGLFGALFLLKSYYICFLFGSVLALGKSFFNDCSQNGRKIVLCVGIGLAAIKMAEVLPQFFAKYQVNNMLSSYSFYNMIGALGVIAGCILLFEKRKGTSPVRELFKWFGNRSFSIFFIHWVIICSFSCFFFIKAYLYGKWLSIGVNFILSFAIIMLISHVFYKLVEVSLFSKIWNCIKSGCFEEARNV